MRSKGEGGVGGGSKWLCVLVRGDEERRTRARIVTRRSLSKFMNFTMLINFKCREIPCLAHVSLMHISIAFKREKANAVEIAGNVF
jgi:hypothetical protein